jgi:hypothetical protein
MKSERSGISMIEWTFSDWLFCLEIDFLKIPGVTHMGWINYAVCFLAGAFLTNAVPHFVQGISGNRFPTPFARPHGKGLSSPLVNVLWALFNMFVGIALARFGRVSMTDLSMIFFLAGLIIISIFSSIVFSKKDRE